MVGSSGSLAWSRQKEFEYQLSITYLLYKSRKNGNDHEDAKDDVLHAGEGAIGVEFAGTAVTSPCPYGANISLATANNYSSIIQNANDELQWQDLYYRGYYELHISGEEVVANFFGLPTVVQRNGWEIPIANFTVKAGANRLQRPVAGGVVESGSLKGGKTVQTNATIDTNNGTWFVSHAALEVL